MKWVFLCFTLVALSVVAARECPIAASEADDSDVDSTLECLDNEVFSQCDANSSCQKTCANIDTWGASPCLKTKECVPGCICKEGYARDTDGKCIIENRCPRVRH